MLLGCDGCVNSTARPQDHGKAQEQGRPHTHLPYSGVKWPVSRTLDPSALILGSLHPSHVTLSMFFLTSMAESLGLLS